MHRALPLLGLAALLVLGCARNRASAKPVPDVTPLRTLPLDSVWILGAGGTPPADTVVQVVPGRPRAVVLRHPAPDQATFAVIEFGAGSFEPGDAARVAFHVPPGVFGLDVTADRPFRDATVTFKYARYFVAPADARVGRATDAELERRLAIGRHGAAGVMVLLPTRRPTADNVSARLDGPGSYVVAGTR